MKRIIYFCIFISLILNPSFAWKKKKIPSKLYLSNIEFLSDDYQANSVNYKYFLSGEKIYFLIENPQGFKSNYIKYQVVKQNDNAHVGGYTRILNATKKVKNKYYYSDYFVLREKGKYYLQIFDITDTNHWLNIEEFMVVYE